MADLPWLRSQLIGRPHLVLPTYADTVISVLADRLSVRFDAAPPETPVTPRTAKYAAMADGVFVLPITGGLVHRGMNVAPSSGEPAAYTAIHNEILGAVRSNEVNGILLDIDSPGGMAVGCFELAEAIRAMGKEKPIWAIANGMAASAAYAIASSASRLNVTPSGAVGSIGVVYTHTDVSEAVKKQGVAITFIYAGKHKIDGNPYQPLPASVKEDVQTEVDAKYEQFVDLVAARRPMTSQQIRKTEAAMFGAEDAVAKGLADEVASFDATLTAFQRELRPKRTVVSVSPTGAATVTQNAPAAPAAQTTQIEGLSEALTRAREDGIAAGRAAMTEAIQAAYRQGRVDAHAIISHEAAQGRLSAALEFAGDIEFSVEKAVSVLAKIPAESGASNFKDKLKAQDPKVPAGAATDLTDAMTSHDQMVKQHLARLIPSPKQ